MAVWLHGLWAYGQLGHHGEAHACGGAKQTISWRRGSQRTDRRKSPDRLDPLRPCIQNLLPYFDLPLEVSTASQQLTRLLVHK